MLNPRNGNNAKGTIMFVVCEKSPRSRGKEIFIVSRALLVKHRNDNTSELTKSLQNLLMSCTLRIYFTVIVLPTFNIDADLIRISILTDSVLQTPSLQPSKHTSYWRNARDHECQVLFAANPSTMLYSRRAHNLKTSETDEHKYIVD